MIAFDTHVWGVYSGVYCAFALVMVGVPVALKEPSEVVDRPLRSNLLAGAAGAILALVPPSGARESSSCHTGHSFTAAALLTSQTEKVEETLWTALRMFEERENLLNNMSRTEISPARKRIRSMLVSRQPKASME